MSVSYPTTTRNDRLNLVTTAAGGASFLQIYDGAIPALPTDTPAGTLLASLACSATLAAGASGGVLTIGTITDDTTANASGTPTFARISTTETGDGGVVMMSAGVAGGDLSFDAAIVAGGTVSVTSLTITDGSATTT